jgi:hypothetical protein
MITVYFYNRLLIVIVILLFFFKLNFSIIRVNSFTKKIKIPIINRVLEVPLHTNYQYSCGMSIYEETTTFLTDV